MRSTRHYEFVPSGAATPRPTADVSSCLTFSAERGGAFTLVSVPRGWSNAPVPDTEYLAEAYGFAPFPLPADFLEIPPVPQARVVAAPGGVSVSLAERPWVGVPLRLGAHPEWVKEASAGTTVLGICFGVDLDATGIDGFFTALDANEAVLGEAATRWVPDP